MYIHNYGISSVTVLSYFTLCHGHPLFSVELVSEFLRGDCHCRSVCRGMEAGDLDRMLADLCHRTAPMVLTYVRVSDTIKW